MTSTAASANNKKTRGRARAQRADVGTKPGRRTSERELAERENEGGKRAEISEETVRRLRLLSIVGGVAIGVGTLFYSGYEYGAPGAVLVLTGLALVGVIAAFWNSVRTLIGENRLTGADAFAIGSPRVEEEQKRAVLRAMKDLEFERAVGKISEEDYKALIARYRNEAKRLLRMIDEESAAARAHAEELVRKRLAQRGLGQGGLAEGVLVQGGLSSDEPAKAADQPVEEAPPAFEPPKPAFEPINEDAQAEAEAEAEAEGERADGASK